MRSGGLADPASRFDLRRKRSRSEGDDREGERELDERDERDSGSARDDGTEGMRAATEGKTKRKLSVGA